MTPETRFEKFIRLVFERKIWCLFGWHNWQASLDDYLEEFGVLGLNNNKICSKSICGTCGKRYRDNKNS